MQEVFEKIIEKLEEENRRLKSLRNNCIALSDSEVNAIENKAYNFSIEIVKQEAEKYNNGWVPCSSGKLPDEGDEFYPMCFVALDNGAVCLGVYRYDDKQWYTKMIKDETLYTTKRNVIAWQPLPEPYQQKGDKHGNDK